MSTVAEVNVLWDMILSSHSWAGKGIIESETR